MAGLTARDPGGGQNFDPVDEGMHQAICYALYDLGTQYSERFGKSAPKVIIVWELPDERITIEDETGSRNLPRAISKIYTCSLHEKANLRKDLESWRGRSFTDDELKGFDLKRLLEVNCTLQILHKRKDDKVYANIVSIVPLIKGMTKRKPENPVRHFSFEENTNIPPDTPDWIADLIRNAEEWGRGIPEDSDEMYSDPTFDDIPF